MLQELKLFLDYITENDSVCFYKEYINTRDFSARQWCEWIAWYRSDREIACAWEKICDLLETRLNLGSLNKDLQQSAVLCNLKELYGWNKKEDGERPFETNVSSILDDVIAQNTPLVTEED